MNRYLKVATFTPFLIAICAFASGNNYKNFDVATYATVRDVVLMNDTAYLESRWEAMSKYVKYDKIYLETSRDMIIADQASLDARRKLFLSKGLKVSGGITWTVDERNGVTFCYSERLRKSHRKVAGVDRGEERKRTVEDASLLPQGATKTGIDYWSRD